jgi:hypothetical protein
MPIPRLDSQTPITDEICSAISRSSVELLDAIEAGHYEVADALIAEFVDAGSMTTQAMVIACVRASFSVIKTSDADFVIGSVYADDGTGRLKEQRVDEQEPMVRDAVRTISYLLNDDIDGAMAVFAAIVREAAVENARNGFPEYIVNLLRFCVQSRRDLHDLQSL